MKIKWDRILALAILGGIAFFLLWKAWGIYQEIGQMNDWEAQEARLIMSYLDVNDKMDDDPSTYRVKVSYEYQVDGESYTSDRLGFGYIHSNMDNHHEVAEKLKYANKIGIWVDPDEPAESSIVKGWSETALFMMMFAFIWVCGFSGFLLWDLDTRSNHLRLWAKALLALAVITFVLYFCRLGIPVLKDKYVIKLEDKVEVLEYKVNEEIKREKLLEKAKNEAFRRAETGQDTIRIRLEQDTFYVK